MKRFAFFIILLRERWSTSESLAQQILNEKSRDQVRWQTIFCQTREDARKSHTFVQGAGSLGGGGPCLATLSYKPIVVLNEDLG